MEVKRLQKAEGIQIGCSQMKVGLQWDIFEGQQEVDLDASCVLFDDFGRILDAAFYNQKETEDKSVTHSGDCKDGKIEGDDEFIIIDFTKMSQKVKAIVIVLNAYQGGDFSNVETAKANVSDTHINQPIVSMSLARKGKHTGLIMCTIFRDDFKNWHIKNIDRVCGGKNFQEVEFEMKEELYFLIPPEIMGEVKYDPNSQKSFNMKKEQVLNIPQGMYSVGLGWDSKCDLDASVGLLDAEGKYHEFIYYGAKVSKDKSVKHSGDNRTGDGSGDDETIHVNLSKLNKAYTRVIFVVTIYSKGFSFQNVKGAYIRLIDQAKKKEMCRYKLSGSYSSNGMIMSSIFRNPNSNQWKFKAIGESAQGHTIFDLKSILLQGKVKKPKPQGDVSQKISQLKKVIEEEEKKNISLIKAFATNCDKKDVFSLSDPYYILTINGKKIYQSEAIDNTLDPKWKSVNVGVGDKSGECDVKVWDHNSVMKHSFIGECKFRLSEVYGHKNEVKFDLINTKKKGNQVAGQFYISINHFDNKTKHQQLKDLEVCQKQYDLDMKEYNSGSFIEFFEA
eukprot:gene2155-2020_t